MYAIPNFDISLADSNRNTKFFSPVTTLERILFLVHFKTSVEIGNQFDFCSSLKKFLLTGPTDGVKVLDELPLPLE